jgi:DNA-binding response OmpR family regulator
MTAHERVTVLAVSPADEDYNSLLHIFSHSNWQIDRARTVAEATAAIQGGQCAVVICAAELPDGDWKTILEAANSSPTPPRVIVSSSMANDRLWAEVLDSGGYDLLGKPYDASEVVRVVSLAWRQWRHDRERQPGRRTATEDGTNLYSQS